MDNNERNNGGAGKPAEHGSKKPYYKHHHHRRRPNDVKPRENAVQNPVAEAERASAVNSESVQPTAVQTAADEIRHDNGHHNRHRGDKRRDGAQNGDNRETAVISENADSVTETDGAAHSEHRRRRRNDRHRRGNRHSQPNAVGAESADETITNEAPEESVEAESSAETVAETEISEYVTTAGSLDEQVVEELNSVSESDVAAIEACESDIDAELARYEIVGVRFKAGGKIYYFDPAGAVLSKGDAVVVETSRGLEYGICEISNRTVTEREVVLPLRTVVRPATHEDTVRHESNVAHEKEAFAICSQKIQDHNLGMKLIDVEYAFDGSKLLFYFTAEGRVDFRELVKDLAAVFRTRIELRQIGIRDETKLLGGIGICGRPFCCKTFLSDFVQVSIKMAKEQNLSLNSVKISGACGRLMCCLRYEYDVYQEEIKKTPKVDQIVSTPDGDGTVIEVQPLAGLVRVRFGTKADMITPKVYHRDEVTVIGGKGVKPKEPTT